VLVTIDGVWIGRNENCIMKFDPKQDRKRPRVIYCCSLDDDTKIDGWIGVECIHFAHVC
jgi:hypothetical protein